MEQRVLGSPGCREEVAATEAKGSARELLAKGVRPALWVGILLAAFQQITGINTVIYYAPTLLEGAGLGNDASLLADVVDGVVNVGVTIVAIRLLDRTGRRPLLRTPKGVLFLFAFLTGLAWVYLATRVPETKQRSLQEIERDLGATTARRPPRLHADLAGGSEGQPPAARHPAQEPASAARSRAASSRLSTFPAAETGIASMKTTSRSRL